MQIREVMTESVVTAAPDAPVRLVALPGFSFHDRGG